jgi:hypothetical protein
VRDQAIAASPASIPWERLLFLVSVTDTSGSDPLAPALSALIAANTMPSAVKGPRSGQCAVTGM